MINYKMKQENCVNVDTTNSRDFSDCFYMLDKDNIILEDLIA